MIPKIEIDHVTCDKEGLCVRVCADGVFEQEDRDSFPVAAHPEKCFFCGQCVAVCPGDSITHHGFDMTNFPHHTAEMDIAPDTLIGFLRLRRSVREYNPRRPVRRETVMKLIDAARYAPTGSNAQSLEHIIINDREKMDTLALHSFNLFRKRVNLSQDGAALSALDPRTAKRIRAERPFYERVIADYEAGKDPFFYQAPVLIVTHADLTITSCPLEDATLASYQMMLVAQSLGLGTCYIGNFYEYANESQAISEILGIPPKNEILMSFTLGYPAIRFRRLIDRNEPEVRWLGSANESSPSAAYQKT
jgi:nitroreductase/NAD-dependent dihydropyrimidine dehydrogenase PreA subunit